MNSCSNAVSTESFAFEYMYRDAGNWKTFGLIVLDGPTPPDIANTISAALDGGLLFVAEQVDVPPLQQSHIAEYGSSEEDLDHAFHEIVDLRLATSDDRQHAIKSLSAARVAKLFGEARGRWDCRLSPYGRC